VITVLIMAGGTGGHVFPALAVARVLESRSCRVVWLGTRQGIEARLVPAAGISVEWVRVSGLRGKGALSWLSAPFRLLRALVDSIVAVRRVKPDVVLGLGGFVAGPGGIAAKLLGCPLVIHEQNAVAGLTNRVLAHLSQVVAEAFPGAFSASVGALSVGNPVRPEIESQFMLRSAPRRPPHLLVFGGSQGAAVLNRTLPAALAAIPVLQRPQVLHQTGRGRATAVSADYLARGVDADVREFLDDMAGAYSWADLAIARSGALTVAELAAAGVPGVLVPFPAAVDDHQTQNARYLTDRGAALLMPERDLDEVSLAEAILGLLADGGAQLGRMSESARAAAKLGAAEVLADLCLAQIERRAA
jgi:UDP-N-acetylglucosamine--N-acetylmuramyl-(pentapeptide) pyrophosphoryl-undecaprenol N-acetylglucosamine transferase